MTASTTPDAPLIDFNDIRVEFAVNTILLPLITAAIAWTIVVLTARLFPRSPVPRSIPPLAAPAAIAAGFVVAFIRTNAVDSFWPRNAEDQVAILFAIAATLLAWLAGALVWFRVGAARTITRYVIITAAAAVILAPLGIAYHAPDFGWTVPVTTAHIVAAIALVLAYTAVADAVNRPAQNANHPTLAGHIPPGVLAVIVAMSAIVLFNWGLSTGIRIMPALAMLLGLQALLALPPINAISPVNLRTAGPVVALATVAVWASAHFSSYDPIDPLSVATLTMTPFAILLLQIPALDPARGLRQAIVGAIASLLLAAALAATSLAFATGTFSTPGFKSDTTDTNNAAPDNDWSDFDYSTFE